MAYNVSSTKKKLFGDSSNLLKLSNSQGMQGTFGAEVIESWSGSLIKIATTK